MRAPRRKRRHFQWYAFANFTFFGLSLFAVFYGLDWIFASHRIGAASAPSWPGPRAASGSYLDSFVAAGFVALFAAVLTLTIGTKDRSAAQAAV